MNNTIRKFKRLPRTMAMLARIEWGQYCTRGMRGYVKLCYKNLRANFTSKYPQSLQVEPYGGCNIRCKMCFQGKITLPADDEFMDMGLFQRIINEVSPYTSRLYLFWRGEPFLHPQLGKMIAYARASGMYVFVSTNASLIDKDRAQELIDAKLDFLLVGFDGATKDSFESMRCGAKFDRIVKNISELVKLKRAQKAILPHISLQFIVSSINNHELPLLYQLARQIGADSTIERMLDIYVNLNNNKIDKALSELHVDGEWSKYERRDGNTFSTKASITDCKMAQRLVIRADGELGLCCYDFQGHYPIASICNGAIMDLWFDPNYVTLRKLGKKRRLPLCENCGAGIQR